MKKLFIPLITALLAVQPLLAEEKSIPITGAEALPDPKRNEERLELMPSQSPRLPVELPPIPDAPAKELKKRVVQEIEQEEKKSKTEIAADQMQERVRFRQAKTKAIADPAVQAAWDRAHLAKTDYEKREVMKNYYTLLYRLMDKSDGRIKGKVALEKARSLHRLDQTRIDPTEAFEGYERD